MKVQQNILLLASILAMALASTEAVAAQRPVEDTKAAQSHTAAPTPRYRAGDLTNMRRYDPRRDEVRNYEGVHVAPRHRPGGDDGYYGNRLTQYQWLGAPAKGGYYDAWEQYKREMKLDPRKYQYRR